MGWQPTEICIRYKHTRLRYRDRAPGHAHHAHCTGHTPPHNSTLLEIIDIHLNYFLQPELKGYSSHLRLCTANSSQ